MAKSPKSPVTDAQKKAFDARIRKDAWDLAGTAAMAIGSFLDQNPENVIAQVASHPMVKASLMTAAQHARAARERAAAAEAEAEAEADAKRHGTRA